MNGLDYLKFLTERFARNINKNESHPDSIKYNQTHSNYYNQYFGIIPLVIKILLQKKSR